MSRKSTFMQSRLPLSPLAVAMVLVLAWTAAMVKEGKSISRTVLVEASAAGAGAAR